MNWKLIFLLSLFGLAMAIGTVFVIPSHVEPLFWLLIFVVCAYLIAKNAGGKFFLHGLMTSLANCVWITALHILFFSTYAANHVREFEQMSKGPLANHPRLMMLIVGPIIGLVSGLVLGLFSLLAAKMVHRKK